MMLRITPVSTAKFAIFALNGRSKCKRRNKSYDVDGESPGRLITVADEGLTLEFRSLLAVVFWGPPHSVVGPTPSGGLEMRGKEERGRGSVENGSTGHGERVEGVGECVYGEGCGESDESVGGICECVVVQREDLQRPGVCGGERAGGLDGEEVSEGGHGRRRHFRVQTSSLFRVSSGRGQEKKPGQPCQEDQPLGRLS
eukprot:Gb_20242 [translate_table: standard]